MLRRAAALLSASRDARNSSDTRYRHAFMERIMALTLPDRIHDALDSLCIPGTRGEQNNPLARIQQLQIDYHLEEGDEQPEFTDHVLWKSPPGSVALVYALFVARQFLVRCAYHGGHVGIAGSTYDPSTITSALAFGTPFDLAVAKHVFEYFYRESARRWREYAESTGVPRSLEHETQFVYGLWEGLVPKESSFGHPIIVSHIARLDYQAALRFAKYPKAPYPHDAVRLSTQSVDAYSAGRVAQPGINPTIPSMLQGESS